MKKLIKERILVSTLLLLGLTSYAVATPSLPVSSQMSKGAEEEKIEIVQEIKIKNQSSSSPSNPSLKEGNACSDENLEEIQGELITVLPALPMAKTIPCDTVDCKDLKPAQMGSYKMRKLPPTAKTINCSK